MRWDAAKKLLYFARTLAFRTNIIHAVDLYRNNAVAGRYRVYRMPPLNPSARFEVRIVGKTRSAEMRMCI